MHSWALDGGEWSASRPSRVTPEQVAPDKQWRGGWVGPRTCMDAMVENFPSIP